MGDGTAFDKQNIVTFTIGFKSNQDLLQRTATHGGGEYFTAEAYSELREAFDQIMSTCREERLLRGPGRAHQSHEPRVRRRQDLPRVLQAPAERPLDRQHQALRARIRRDPARRRWGRRLTTSDGLIKENALSWWTSLGNDGPAVEKGGVAEVLEEALEAGTTRTVYTYTGSQAALPPRPMRS